MPGGCGRGHAHVGDAAGVKKVKTEVRASALNGALLDDPKTRAEFRDQFN